MASRLADELVRQGVLDPELREAIERSPALSGKSFALRLYQSSLIPAEVMFATLLRLGSRDATERLDPLPSARVLALVPSRIAGESCLLPFERRGNRLHVAMLDPSDERAIENLALFSRLAVEPYAARAQPLFKALYEGYRIPVPSTLTHFDVATSLETSVLPPPRSVDLPVVSIRAHNQAPSALPADLEWEDPPNTDVVSVFGESSRSPLVQTLRDFDAPLIESGPHPVPDAGQEALPQHSATPSPKNATADDTEPVPLVRVTGWSAPGSSATRVEGWRQELDEEELRQARQDLAQQVLPGLGGSFWHVALFLLRHELAVGWDGCGPHLNSTRIRDVLLPISPPSTLRRALTTRQCVTGDPARIDAIDRILLTFLGDPEPSQWLVLPLFAGDGVVGLLYADTQEGELGELQRATADAMASTLSDSLHVLVERYGRVI